LCGISSIWAVLIIFNLPTQFIGQTIRYYETIGSTNTELKRLADEHAPEGMLLVADEQSAGRGRFKRVWQAPKKGSLLTSLLFRPTFLHPHNIQHLTMICSLAMIESIKQETCISVNIKWPNDLVFDNRKLAGVLTEASFIANKLSWIVVGLGVNVNFDVATCLPEFAQTAISLQTIAGHSISRLALLRNYLVHVEKWYHAMCLGKSPHKAWKERLTMLGQSVIISTNDHVFEGIAEDVEQTGALQLRLPNGKLKSVLAGDVLIPFNSTPTT